jgi:hypothetical protein
MAFNVADFASNIARYGTLQTNKFEVIVNDINIGNRTSLIAKFLSDERLDEDERFSINSALTIYRSRIDSVRLPGVTSDTYETKRYGVGPNIKATTNVRFEPLSVSILVDKNYDLYKFFHIWMNQTFEASGKISGSDSSGLFPLYLTSYKKEYATEIDIKVFENTGETKALYKFYEIFPIGITNPNLSWRDNNNLFKFDVSFAYTNWAVSNNPTLGNRGLADTRRVIEQARNRPQTETP